MWLSHDLRARVEIVAVGKREDEPVRLFGFRSGSLGERSRRSRHAWPCIRANLTSLHKGEKSGSKIETPPFSRITADICLREWSPADIFRPPKNQFAWPFAVSLSKSLYVIEVNFSHNLSPGKNDKWKESESEENKSRKGRRFPARPGAQFFTSR